MSGIPLFKKFVSFLDETEHIIYAQFHDYNPFIGKIASHLISSGGKRLRPLMMFVCRDMIGAVIDKRLLKLAAAVEMIHSATLMHDDIIDNSLMRRGKKTSHIVWGNSAAILVGDFLFATAFQCMTSCQDTKVLDYLSRVSGLIIEGEIKQLNQEEDLKFEDYIDIISAKTAALFEASCVTAGLLDQATPHIEALKDFGKYFGLAFQMIDDVLDYFGDPKDMKKNIGQDFKERKMTLPAFLALEEDPVFFDSSFEEASLTMRKNNIKESAYEKIHTLLDKAYLSLSPFDESETKNFLREWLMSQKLSFANIASQ